MLLFLFTKLEHKHTFGKVIKLPKYGKITAESDTTEK